MKLLRLTLLAAATITMMGCATEQATEQRLDEVAERGRHVMPFDLEQTTHVFNKVANGGIQQVVVKDNANLAQIKLIREHLSKISREFKQRDFSDPVKIHGKNMPGLELMHRAKADALAISYKELADGAEIDYVSQQPEVIEAIHQFFDAQLRDHARHSVSGHSMHHNMNGHKMGHSHSMLNMSQASAYPATTAMLDQRLVFDLTEKQRQHFLTDMRTLLAGTQGIVSALANNDMQAVAKAAKAIGMDMKHNPDANFHSAIPKAMMHMGMGMHHAFDEIAKDAETMQNAKHTLQQLSQAMTQCLACHATYQINKK